MIVTFVASVLVVTATEPANVVPQSKTVVFGTIGRVDRNVFQRTTNFVSIELGCPVRLAAIPASTTNASVANVSALTNLLTTSDACIVVIVDSRFEIRGVSTGSVQKVGMLELSGLREGMDQSNLFVPVSSRAKDTATRRLSKEEVFARRVEKETMRLIGRLIGMPECSSPFCALCATKTTQELDAKGRNFCPPCQGKAAELLTK